MTNIFFAPHSDDEALFGSYIIQRTKPIVIVCTDGTSHQKKFGIPIEQRRQESRDACKILGVYIEFLGYAEEELNEEKLRGSFQVAIQLAFKIRQEEISHVFAPSKQSGHLHHDIVSDAVKKTWPQTLFYSTYSKDSLQPIGEIPIVPTEQENEIKQQALTCYVSQLKINPQHFKAVKNQPEYLNFNQL